MRTQKYYRWSERSYRSWDQIAKHKSDGAKASFPHHTKINEKADVEIRRGKTTIDRLPERDLLEGNWRSTGAHPGELCCKMTTPAVYCFELLLL